MVDGSDNTYAVVTGDRDRNHASYWSYLLEPHVARFHSDYN